MYYESNDFIDTEMMQEKYEQNKNEYKMTKLMHQMSRNNILIDGAHGSGGSIYNNHTPRSSVHFGNNSRAMTMAERRGSRIRKGSISRGREGSLVRGIKPKLGSGIFN
jgi:hypothetical protein